MIKDLKWFKDNIILKCSLSYSKNRILDFIRIDLITKIKTRMNREVSENKEKELTIS